MALLTTSSSVCKKISILFCCMTITTFMYAAESAQPDLSECNQADLEQMRQRLEHQQSLLAQRQHILEQQWHEFGEQEPQSLQQWELEQSELQLNNELFALQQDWLLLQQRKQFVARQQGASAVERDAPRARPEKRKRED